MATSKPSWMDGVDVDTKLVESSWSHPTVMAKESTRSVSIKSGRSSARSDAGLRAVRELNKRLRTVYEDEGRTYGEDLDGETLIDRYKICSGMATKGIQDVMTMLRKAHDVDLCFLVDITGSMQPHVDSVRQSILNIVTSLKKECSTGQSVQRMRLAFVGYRDHGDANRFQVLDLTEDVTVFKSFCSSISASGGADAPEDVFGGIQKAIQLNWSSNSGTKVIFHIADAPCHGSRYHSCGDSYPGGDPHGLTDTGLFGDIRSNLIQYHFGKINSSTDKMVELFSHAYGEPITSFDIKNVAHIKESVVTAVSVSVARSVASSKSGTRGMKEREYTLTKAVPEWSSVRIEVGSFLTYELPASIQDVIDGIPLTRRLTRDVRVKIAPHPFGAGAERIAYYGLHLNQAGKGTSSTKGSSGPSSTTTLRSASDGYLPPVLAGMTTKRSVSHDDGSIQIVLKEYKHIGKNVNSAARYEMSNQIQTIAAYLARGFHNEIKKNKSTMGMQIKFLKTKTLAVALSNGKRRLMSCERLLLNASEFIRFSNNVDYSIMSEKIERLGIDKHFVDLLMAFSHWSYHGTKGYMMVVDLQGVVCTNLTTGKPQLLLTDPALHCEDVTQFRPMNLGKKGMKLFFDSHKCNDYCRQLLLKKPDMNRVDFGDVKEVDDRHVYFDSDSESSASDVYGY